MGFKTRIVIGNVIVVALVMTISSFYFISSYRSEMTAQAKSGLRAKMNMLKDNVLVKGSIKLIDGKLKAGDYILNDNFEIPDKIKANCECVATIFMGDTRVSTNVMTKEGTRAVGTKLQGKAFEALFVKKDSYTGETNILDEPYFTAYEPIKDDKGDVIGVFFVGSKKSDFLHSFNQMIIFAVIGSIVLAVLSSIMIALICSRALKPLNGMVVIMEKAATGDLSLRANVTGNDEIGRLGTAFNTMMTDMNKAMRQFFSVADTVRDAVVLVRSSTDAMASASEDVAIQASTIATASEEMSATSGDIARNCLYAAESAQKATEQTHCGSQLVQSSSRLMENIAQRVNVSSQTVEGLGQRSDQIGAIVNTIQDIADQTNLLALNAAIEAARAGEQGRGFAVVADEVRALAERTTKATKEIAAMIKAIQSETQSAVSSMSEGVDEVKRGTAETTRSGEALEDILNKINDLTMQISQVATAAEEQTATTQEITNNIQMITDVVNLNVENARSTTQATTTLARDVDSLHELVGKFHLSKVLEWDESFATGVSKYDEHHKILFNMVNDLADAMQQKKSKEAIGRVLNGLAEYTVNHFADEERSFAQTHYPEEAQHKAMHKTLLDQVKGLITKFNAGEPLIAQNVINFLEDWLINHIKGADKRYGAHLNKNGIK